MTANGRAASGDSLRILVYSRPFFPLVGGVETMAMMLAEEFTALGHRVTVVTRSVNPDEDRFAFTVLRKPSPWRFLEASLASDVILHMNLSLRGAWVLPFVRARWVVAHGAQYRREAGRRFLRDHFKVWAARRALNIACSRAILADLPSNSTVIENAYDDRVFHDRGLRRDRDILFVGRLVEGKGVDLLLKALALLGSRGRAANLTVVGDGPDRKTLEAAAGAAGLGSQVAFLGALSGDDLADVMNRHRVLAVPSRVEAFGIVALEGLACGCAVAVSDVGGLPEAVGACGIRFAPKTPRPWRTPFHWRCAADPRRPPSARRTSHGFPASPWQPAIFEPSRTPSPGDGPAESCCANSPPSFSWS